MVIKHLVRRSDFNILCMKTILIFTTLLISSVGFSQMSSQGGTSAIPSFIDYQKSFTRPADALSRKEDTLQKQFREKGLVWPARYVYIRSFKYDSQLEVWVKNEREKPYKLFKTYKVCALAGTLGPKRMEGDYQVPEGFYYINEFNANSSYHLSLGLNYPNASDRVLSDSVQPGGAIYIHGSCVTVGCIPLTDPMIEEVYIITAHAKNQGQDFIPVHIYPVKFNVKRSVDYLTRITKDDPSMQQFASQLEDAFNYFERYKQVPIVMVNENGNYLVNNAPVKKTGKETVVKVKSNPVPHRTREVATIPAAVHKWPQYPGGSTEFTRFLETTGREMANLLPAGINKAHVQVEFVIDADGVPVNFRVIKGVDADFDDELIIKLEKNMQTWEPAQLHDKPVPKKMVQIVTVEASEVKEIL